MVKITIGSHTVSLPLACDSHSNILVCRLTYGGSGHRLIVYDTELPAGQVSIVELTEHFARTWVVGGFGCHDTIISHHFGLSYQLPCACIESKVDNKKDSPT